MAPQTEKKKIFFSHYLKKMYEIFFLHYFLNYSGRKTHSTTPFEFTEPHRPTPPPLEIGPENSINSPLEFTEPHRLPPPPESGRKTPSTPPSNSRAGTEIRPPKFNS